MRWGVAGREEGGGRGTETDEQLCQVDFAPLGKGNLSVGEETAGEEEIKVTHTHTHTHTQKKAKKDKVSGVEGAGGGGWGLGGWRRGRVIAPGCTHPPPLHLTSLCLPPRAKR